jgi:hypothetical protein
MRRVFGSSLSCLWRGRSEWCCALVIIAACGRPSNGSASDASVGDADRLDSMSADASGDAALFTPIQVTVYDENNPGHLAAGVRVVFVAPDLTAQTVWTDTNGVAHASSPPGTSITAVQTVTVTSTVAFSTVMGLQPGDSVAVGPRSPTLQPGPIVVIHIPTAPNGMFYSFYSSCPYQGTPGSDDTPTKVTPTFLTPCSSLSAATLVARVRDADLNEIGVSVLDNVDLNAASGGSLTMPDWGATQNAIAANLSNVPATADDTSWFTYYYRGGEFEQVLDQASASSGSTGTFDLSGSIYPFGDETTFVLSINHDHLAGHGFSEYHAHVDALASSFGLDATNMITSVADAETTTGGISWTESTSGQHASIVTASVSWGSVVGVITMPYAGTSLSFSPLPMDLQPTVAPKIVDLQLISMANASSYTDSLAQMDELSSPHENWMSASTNYWRAFFPGYSGGQY